MSQHDVALVDDLRNGTPRAWERLIDRYGSLALSVPLRMGLSEVDAEEVCQATWVILHRHLFWIEKPGSLAAWIQTTAGRESMKLLQSRGRYQPLEDELARQLEDEKLLPREQLERLERLQRVREIVARMPAPSRSLVAKLFFDPSEPSYAEIARSLSVPVGSIGPMRGRLLARLARALRSSWDAPDWSAGSPQLGPSSCATPTESPRTVGR